MLVLLDQLAMELVSSGLLDPQDNLAVIAASVLPMYASRVYALHFLQLRPALMILTAMVIQDTNQLVYVLDQLINARVLLVLISLLLANLPIMTLLIVLLPLDAILVLLESIAAQVNTIAS